MKVGDRVPGFEAQDQTGEVVRSADLLEKGAVVLFFYPRAMSPGCTTESCHFRDLQAELAELSAQPVGVSVDPVDRQAAFAERNDLGFPLLSDPDRHIARIFGVKRIGPLFNKRATFVIDRDGTVLDVITSELNMAVHADRAIDCLRART
ncbi:MAG: peroxiredoxin [Actinomycetota bacterium]|nr:peroxiredoxin [Actinomycetota bacterium]